MAAELTIPDGVDSGMVDDDWFHTPKKEMRCQGWTDIVEGDRSMASGLVESEFSKDEHSIYGPSAGETAGARFT